MPQIVVPPENKIPEKRPIITTCPRCNYTISYTEDEVERVTNDGVGVLCPNCNEPIVLEHIEPFTFPDTFYHFSTRFTRAQCHIFEYFMCYYSSLNNEFNIKTLATQRFLCYYICIGIFCLCNLSHILFF